MTYMRGPIENDEFCPNCSGVLSQDSVDVGIGKIYGPAGCFDCGWSEVEEYDSTEGVKANDSGYVFDPIGRATPPRDKAKRILDDDHEPEPMECEAPLCVKTVEHGKAEEMGWRVVYRLSNELHRHIVCPNCARDLGAYKGAK